MTLIRDGRGTRWVEIPQRPRRGPARAVRFADIKVGDQVMRRWADCFGNGGRVWYYVVSDLWFDPVAGQKDDTAGRMVAIQHVNPRDGDLGRKEGHTLRGLASQGFHYADVNFLTLARLRAAEIQAGAVVGIGKGHIIRARPKLPGSTF